MKKLFLSVTALTLAICSFAQKKATDVAKFNSETIDLGNIKQAVPATATFIVTNTGTEPLIIEQANPTCGCTMGDYTKAPIAPGKTGTITATYNAMAGGPFDKHLTVKFAGVDEVQSITLKGTVLPEAEYVKWKSESGTSVVVAAPTTEKPATASKTVKTQVKSVAKKTKKTTKPAAASASKAK
jgi:Protein of unknown function (DUF1573)